MVPEKKVKKDKPSSSKCNKPAEKSVVDHKYEELDKKWTDRFNRLEALFMAKTLQPSDQPTFSASVRVPPSHSPPTAISKDSELFFQPLSTGRTGTDSSVLVHQSASQPGSDVSPSSQRTGKDISTSQHLSSSQLVSDRQTVRSASSPKRTGINSSAKHQSASLLKPDRHRPRSSSPRRTGKDSSVSVQQSASLVLTRTDLLNVLVPTLLPPDILLLARFSPTDLSLLWPPTPALHRQRRDSSSSSSSASASDYSDRPPVDLNAEEGELSEDQDLTSTEPDQAISEEQNYRETMSGIRSFMGWSSIPEMDNTTTGSYDEPFLFFPKSSTPGKVSVQMPTEEWLCRKLSKLNITLVEGYPS